MRVIGIDPGLTTGLFFIRFDSTNGEIWLPPKHYELTGRQFGDVLAECLHSDYGDDVLVGCERYFITTHNAKSNQPEALEQTGVAKYLCALAGTSLNLVTKSNILKLASNDRLRAVGWWGRGFTHGNDAARVGLGVAASRAPGIIRHLPGMLQ